MLITFTIISSFAFLVYGFLCLFTKHMQKEFERYGMSHFKLLTGALEMLGGAGLLVGYYYSDAIYALSSLGLATLMLMGLIVRVRIKDPWFQLIPAAVLLVINTIIFYEVLKKLG